MSCSRKILKTCWFLGFQKIRQRYLCHHTNWIWQVMLMYQLLSPNQNIPYSHDFLNFCFPKIYVNEYYKLHKSLTIIHFTTLCCKPLVSFSSSRLAEIFIFCILYDTELKNYRNYPSTHMPVPFGAQFHFSAA